MGIKWKREALEAKRELEEARCEMQKLYDEYEVLVSEITGRISLTADVFLIFLL